MTAGSAEQLSRIVQLVAELSRRERDGQPPVVMTAVAERLGVTARDIERDLRTLTAASESAEQDWLASLSVLQEGDRIAVSSQGPFRRPIRLTPEEILAIQVGLAEEPDAQPLTRELAAMLELKDGEDRRWSIAPVAGPDEAQVAGLARRAAEENRCMEILYARSAAGEPALRVIEVLHVTRSAGHTYLIAWCRRAGGQRHFRADRVLEARLLDETFAPRVVLEPMSDEEIFMAPDEGREEVTVRFAPGIARWLFEDHPGAVPDGEGGVTVRYQVADPAWLVRTVLQYGAEAEVVGPAPYRALMRSAAAAI